jgi:hypothetical protein
MGLLGHALSQSQDAELLLVLVAVSLIYLSIFTDDLIINASRPYGPPHGPQHFEHFLK